MEVCKFVCGYWAAHNNSVVSIHVSSIDTPSLPIFQRAPNCVVKPAEQKPMASAPEAPESSEEEEEDAKADAPARTQVVEAKADTKGKKRGAEEEDSSNKKRKKNRVR